MSKTPFIIETPEAIADIDFERTANYLGQQLDILTDVEGTVSPYSWRAGHLSFDDEVMDAFAEAASQGCVRGIHPITNRAGRGGAYLLELFSAEVKRMPGNLDSIGRQPRSRSERKPSGDMSGRILGALAVTRGLARPRANDAFAVAFIGDKFSDMREAQTIHDNLQFPTIGFMVPRLGTTDHPLDTLFGKRRSANRSLQERRAISPQEFVKIKTKGERI